MGYDFPRFARCKTGIDNCLKIGIIDLTPLFHNSVRELERGCRPGLRGIAAQGVDNLIFIVSLSPANLPSAECLVIGL